jgi:hypothetical protein
MGGARLLSENVAFWSGHEKVCLVHRPQGQKSKRGKDKRRGVMKYTYLPHIKQSESLRPLSGTVTSLVPSSRIVDETNQESLLQGVPFSRGIPTLYAPYIGVSYPL